MTHTITNQYIAQHSGINLRTYKPRKMAKQRDLHAAEGVIVSALIGGNVLIWTYVFVRWLVG